MEDALYRQLYLDQGGSGSRIAALSAAWHKRQSDLKRIEQFDAVFIQKGVFPGLYSGFERKIASRKPFVLDFDDAIWLPRVGGSQLLRALHRESAVQSMMRQAKAVIAGNDFLAEYAKRFNPNVTVVPSSINVSCVPARDQLEYRRLDRQPDNALLFETAVVRVQAAWHQTTRDCFRRSEPTRFRR